MAKPKRKQTSKSIPKILRNFIRIRRFDRYGWACFGVLLSKAVRGEPIDFWLKRSNWIYNFVNHKVMFKGSKL